MLDAVMAVVVVLVGAAATFAFGQWRAERERRDVLLRRYLAQLQDSCESLWFRLKNIAYERADIATDEEYLVTTTMYTLGRALGIERMLAIEGLYPEIWRRFPQLRSALVPRVVDSAVAATTRKARTEQGRELQQYDRITLGEATVVPRWCVTETASARAHSSNFAFESRAKRRNSDGGTRLAPRSWR